MVQPDEPFFAFQPADGALALPLTAAAQRKGR